MTTTTGMSAAEFIKELHRLAVLRDSISPPVDYESPQSQHDACVQWAEAWEAEAELWARADRVTEAGDGGSPLAILLRRSAIQNVWHAEERVRTWRNAADKWAADHPEVSRLPRVATRTGQSG
jgi:hypothetical protein